MPNNDPTETAISVVSNSQPEQITVSYRRRNLTMCHVTETELDTVASLSNSVNLAFFGVTFGSVLAFGITVATVEIPDPATKAIFSALTFVSGVGALYFGVRSAVDYKAAKAKLAELKR